LSLIEKNRITEEVVAEYLLDHPDFFSTRQELVEKMSLPIRQQGAVSLVEIQLQRQRQKITELEEEITELMSIAANNGQHFHRFMSLQETLLKCDTLDQVVEAIKRLATDLSLTAYFKLINDDKAKYHISSEDWQRFAINHFNGKNVYLGRLNKADRNLLFKNNSCPELGSFVILPLQTEKPLGIIAFSSDDGGHFQPMMDTLFLRHLAVVVSHLVTLLKWCNKPQASNVLNHTSA